MNKAKLKVAIILCILFFAMFGCDPQNDHFEIRPGIREYTPLMSSTPGIPLMAVFLNDDQNTGYIFHWITEEGILLDWHEKDGIGRIEQLGKDVRIDQRKIYWTVDFEKEIAGEEFEVSLFIERKDSGEVLQKASITIVQKEKGWFFVNQ